MKKNWPKYCSFILLLVLLAYVIASWYIGKTAQQRIYDLVDRMNQQSTGQWLGVSESPQLKIIDYKRGLFDSDISYELIYPDGYHDNNVAFADHLSHGPFPLAAINAGIYQPILAYSQITPINHGALQGWFDLMAPEQLPWDMDSILYFNGDASADMVLNPISNAEKQLEFSGSHINFNYQAATEKLAVNGNTDKISVWDQDFDLPVQANNIQFKLESDKTNGLLDSETSISAEQILSRGTDIGAIDLVFAVTNLDAAAFQELSNTIGTLGPYLDFSSLDAEHSKKARATADAAFASSAQFTLKNIQWQTASGTTNANLDVQLIPIDSAKAATANDMGAYIEHGIGHIKFQQNLSKSMLVDVLKPLLDEYELNQFRMVYDSYMSSLEREGLVIIDGDNSHSDINYSQGELEINGKKSDFGDLYNYLPFMFLP